MFKNYCLKGLHGSGPCSIGNKVILGSEKLASELAAADWYYFEGIPVF